MPPAPGAVVLRSDVERKALFGVGETERLPQEAYAREVTAKVYAAIEDKARRVLAAGHSAIADAVFADPRERAAIEQAAGDAAFHGLFLTADLGVRVSRVGARTGDASDADAQVARAQEQYDLGALDWATSGRIGHAGGDAATGACGACKLQAMRARPAAPPPCPIPMAGAQKPCIASPYPAGSPR